jgi:hypothetical protein
MIDVGELVRSQLAEVERDRSLRLSVSGESYRHPNGFIHVVLGCPPSRQLVAHVWPSDPGSPGDVHDHRWNLASRVLFGKVQVERFACVSADASDAKPFQGYMHTLLGDNRTFSLRKIPTAWLRIERSEILGIGDLHRSPLTELHRVTNAGSDGEWAVTLMLRGVSQRTRSHIYSTGAPKDIGFGAPLPRLTGDETVAVLRGLKSVVSEAGSSPETFAVLGPSKAR